MNTKSDFDRRASAWLAEGPTELADRVLEAALHEVHMTHQRRRIVVPWRTPLMSTSTRFAAAIAIIAVVGVGVLTLFGRGGVGGQPTPAPTASPTAAPTPTVRVAPTATPIPALTETFTSTIHGISISYPAGWVPRIATGPWSAGEVVNQDSLFADVIEDGSIEDTAFLALASTPVGATSFDQWATGYLAQDEDCGRTEPVTVDGAPGILDLDCHMALVPAGGRGYLIWLYRIDDRSQFNGILETVDLRPEAAVDTAPSAAP